MNLSNEDKLLLLCSAPDITKARQDHIKELLNLSLNWEEVLESAHWYGIAPLLYHNLNNIQERQFIPEKIMSAFEKVYHKNAVRNTYLFQELNIILEALNGNGIDVIILKGIALAETVYGDMGLRPMGDIDFMVKREDLLQAERIVSGLGYHFHGNIPSEKYRENHQEIGYIHNKKKISIDIHWHISNKSHPARIRVIDNNIIENWWKDARSVECYGRKALTLSPEDFVLHLCLHFLKHRFITQNGAFSSKCALLQMCDIFQTIKLYKDEIDWKMFKYKADKYGLVSPVHASLFIVDGFVGKHDDTLHDVLNVFKSEILDEKLISLINKRILVKEKDLTLVPKDVIQSQIPIVFDEKVKTFFKYIFPNRAVISKRYNVPPYSKRLYFYYLVRPLSLLLRYRGIVFESQRIKEELTLMKWINSKDI